MKEFAKILIASVLACVLTGLFLTKCDHQAQEGTTTTHKDSVIVYMVDTNKHSFDKENITIVNSHYHYDGTPVDSAIIFREYFTKNFTRDSIIDSLLKIVISDTVYKNRTAHRNVTYSLLKPYQVIKTITETKETIKFGSGLYIGPYATASKSNASLGIAIDFAKPNQIYGIGIDPLAKTFTGRVTFKLGKSANTK